MTAEIEVEIPLTYAAVRRMAIVAAEASEMADGGVITTTHKKILEVMSRHVVEELTAGRIASVFAVRDGDTVAAELLVEISTLKAYLKTVDLVATQTPRPYVRNNCQYLFTHVTSHVDVEALGLHLPDYETMDLRRDTVFE